MNEELEFCYIAGPISFINIKSRIENLDEFIECEKYLHYHFPKWQILNPAKFEVQDTWAGNLKSDVRLILEKDPKHIVLLPNWQFSIGAIIESCICSNLIKSNVYLYRINETDKCPHLIKLKNFKTSYSYEFDTLFKLNV